MVPDRLEEAAELGALAETRHVSLFGIPLDANDTLRRILIAARDLIPLAVLGCLKRSPRTAIRMFEFLCLALVDRAADVLNDHLVNLLDSSSVVCLK